jgi:hypothetical protein
MFSRFSRKILAPSGQSASPSFLSVCPSIAQSISPRRERPQQSTSVEPQSNLFPKKPPFVANIPYVTLWNISQKENQSSISLPVLSKLCTALGCLPGDLLEYVPDAEDEAIASMLKMKDAANKTTKKRAKK